MSNIYKCDICGRFDFKTYELKTIVVLDHQNEDDFLAKYNYKQDVLIKDICPYCLERLKALISPTVLNSFKVSDYSKPEEISDEYINNKRIVFE